MAGLAGLACVLALSTLAAPSHGLPTPVAHQPASKPPSVLSPSAPNPLDAHAAPKWTKHKPNPKRALWQSDEERLEKEMMSAYDRVEGQLERMGLPKSMTDQVKGARGWIAERAPQILQSAHTTHASRRLKQQRFKTRVQHALDYGLDAQLPRTAGGGAAGGAGGGAGFSSATFSIFPQLTSPLPATVLESSHGQEGVIPSEAIGEWEDTMQRNSPVFADALTLSSALDLETLLRESYEGVSLKPKVLTLPQVVTASSLSSPSPRTASRRGGDADDDVLRVLSKTLTANFVAHNVAAREEGGSEGEQKQGEEGQQEGEGEELNKEGEVAAVEDEPEDLEAEPDLADTSLDSAGAGSPYGLAERPAHNKTRPAVPDTSKPDREAKLAVEEPEAEVERILAMSPEKAKELVAEPVGIGEDDNNFEGQLVKDEEKEVEEVTESQPKEMGTGEPMENDANPEAKISNSPAEGDNPNDEGDTELKEEGPDTAPEEQTVASLQANDDPDQEKEEGSSAKPKEEAADKVETPAAESTGADKKGHVVTKARMVDEDEDAPVATESAVTDADKGKEDEKDGEAGDGGEEGTSKKKEEEKGDGEGDDKDKDKDSESDGEGEGEGEGDGEEDKKEEKSNAQGGDEESSQEDDQFDGNDTV